MVGLRVRDRLTEGTLRMSFDRCKRLKNKENSPPQLGKPEQVIKEIILRPTWSEQDRSIGQGWSWALFTIITGILERGSCGPLPAAAAQAGAGVPSS